MGLELVRKVQALKFQGGNTPSTLVPIGVPNYPYICPASFHLYYLIIMACHDDLLIHVPILEELKCFLKYCQNVFLSDALLRIESEHRLLQNVVSQHVEVVSADALL